VPFHDTAARQDDIQAKRNRERLREERRAVYRDLLDLADVEHIEIDVLAGASAEVSTRSSTARRWPTAAGGRRHA
jgi:hypothetical protein